MVCRTKRLESKYTVSGRLLPTRTPRTHKPPKVFREEKELVIVETGRLFGDVGGGGDRLRKRQGTTRIMIQISEIPARVPNMMPMSFERTSAADSDEDDVDSERGAEGVMVEVDVLS